MRALNLLRALTPLGWCLAVAVGAAVALTLGHGLGLRWDPFDMANRRRVAAENLKATAESDAAARRLEVKGAADQARRLENHHQQAVSVARATEGADFNARNAHDASIPLDPARATRLREHDRQLCALAPAVCPAAPPDATRGGDDALPAGSAA